MRAAGAIGGIPRTTEQTELLETLRRNIELAEDIEAFVRHERNVARDQMHPLEHVSDEARARALHAAAPAAIAQNSKLHRLRAATFDPPAARPGSDARHDALEVLRRNCCLAGEIEGIAANHRRHSRARLEHLERGLPVLTNDVGQANRGERILEALAAVVEEERSP